MPNIRYVCMSDLHLGEEDSLLTAVTDTGELDLSSPSPVLRRLAECLSELIQHNDAAAPKPTLILNGDALELALARDDEAAQVFLQFLAETMPAGSELFGELVCLAGNHDHHLWETARETQYVNYIGRLPSDAPLEAPWHTTKVFMDMQGKDRLASGFLTAIAHRLGHLAHANLEILMAYPNFGLAGADRCVVFHHGHFVEPLYHLMSTVGTLLFEGRDVPWSLDELEGENFAWIDFFWSAMGRSGRFGEDVERVYEATGDKKSLERLTDALAHNIAERYNLQLHLPDFAEEAVLKHLLRAVVVRGLAKIQERQQLSQSPDELPLSQDSREGLRWYLEELLPNHVRVKDRRTLPEPVTFVFGHTHKPFERVMGYKRFSRPVQVLNDGGWIVESVRPEPLRGGAVALIDENLNAVNLRMYNEGQFEVRVADAAESDGGALRDHVRSVIAQNPRPWRAFIQTAEAEVKRRSEMLASRLKKE